MGAVEWAFLTAPTTPIDEDPRNARYLPPEVFVTMSEGSVDQPVGIWINDLFLGEFDVAIGSRGGELRVALTDLQIGQIASMYGGAASLNLRIELAGADWFRLGSDSDLLQDDLYDVGYSGAGMSFFMSQVPTPGTLALLALAGLGASRRRRN
jgi:MYXO-CTERM domain-containing protein